MPMTGMFLLVLAAVSQLLIVGAGVRKFISLVARWSGSQTDTDLPKTIGIVLQAVMFNSALLVLTLPALLKGNMSGGLVVLAGSGFAVVGLSSFIASMLTKSQFATAQLGLSAVGLLCILLSYYLWAGGG